MLIWAEHMFRSWFVFLLVSLQAFAVEDLPVGILDQDVVGIFHPQVMEELSKELA